MAYIFRIEIVIYNRMKTIFFGSKKKKKTFSTSYCLKLLARSEVNYTIKDWVAAESALTSTVGNIFTVHIYHDKTIISTSGQRTKLLSQTPNN